MRSDHASGVTRMPIKKIGGGGQGFGPERGRCVRMEEHGADSVVQRAKRALGLAVLGRRVRAREAERNAIGLEELAQREVIKFTPIVSLKTEDGETELR